MTKEVKAGCGESRTPGLEGGVEKRTDKTQENIEWPNGGSVTSLGR